MATAPGANPLQTPDVVEWVLFSHIGAQLHHIVLRRWIAIRLRRFTRVFNSLGSFLEGPVRMYIHNMAA